MDTLRVEVADPAEDRVTETGLKVTWGPDDDTVEARSIAPENPLRLVKVTVRLPEEPGATVSEGELMAILKSGMTTVTVTVAEWVPDEPVPVTITE